MRKGSWEPLLWLNTLHEPPMVGSSALRLPKGIHNEVLQKWNQVSFSSGSWWGLIQGWSSACPTAPPPPRVQRLFMFHPHPRTSWAHFWRDVASHWLSFQLMWWPQPALGAVNIIWPMISVSEGAPKVKSTGVHSWCTDISSSGVPCVLSYMAIR